MNYAQYLQSGGELELPQVESRLGKKEVQRLVANIINGDEESARILVDNVIKDPENSDIAEVLTGAQEAAQQGNEQAVKFMSIVGPLLEQAQQAQSMKCGGKVRAKMKAGKKMEKGGEAPIKKEAKGGKPCPCTLHKVGGRLIEIDCNGVPVAKDGTKIVYSQTPAVSTLGWLSLQNDIDLVNRNSTKNKTTASSDTYNVSPKLLYLEAPASKPAYIFDPEAHRDPLIDGMNSYQRMKSEQAAKQRQAAEKLRYKEFDATFNAGGINYGKSNPLDIQRMMSPAAAPNPWTEGAVNRHIVDIASAKQNQTSKAAEETAKAAVAREAAASNSQAAPTWRELFNAGTVKYGGLTKAEALARQNEMLAAKAQGFNVNLGRWGADGMWGNQSRGEWERYQQWKADQELAALKAQNSGLLRIESSAALNPTRITVDNSTAAAPLAVTRNGNIVRTGSLTTGQALSQLNTPAWEEYTRRLRQGILSSKNGGKMSYSDYLKQ